MQKPKIVHELLHETVGVTADSSILCSLGTEYAVVSLKALSDWYIRAVYLYLFSADAIAGFLYEDADGVLLPYFTMQPIDDNGANIVQKYIKQGLYTLFDSVNAYDYNGVTIDDMLRILTAEIQLGNIVVTHLNPALREKNIDINFD